MTASLLIAATPLDAVSSDAPVPAKHYLDCSLKSNGNGSSPSAAWNSLTAINSHAAFVPGDQILLKRGTTCKGRLTPHGSGAPSAPILVGSYGSTRAAKPTIAGGGTSNFTGAVELKNQHDWVIQDLHVTNRGAGRWTTVYRSGVLVMNTGGGRLSTTTVRRLTVDNVTSNLADSKKGNSREWGGISVLTHAVYGSGFDGVNLLDNRVTGVSRTGIVDWNSVYNGVHDTRVRIAGNKVVRARGDSIVLVGVAGGRIDHNVSAYGSNMKGCPNCGKVSPKTANAGIWPSGSNNIRIDHNEAYGEHAWGGDGEGFDIDQSARNTTFEYNYAHDNEGGGVLLCGSVTTAVRFNIFENNNKSEIAFIGTYPAKNTSIYNNTIYSSAGSKSRVVRTFNGHRGSGISFKNNIVFTYGPSFAAYQWPTKVSTAANTLIGFQGSGRPMDSKTSKADPGLKRAGSGGNGMGSLKGYKPKHPSSFRRGVAIPASVTTDFFGKKINPKKPPRGAAG